MEQKNIIESTLDFYENLDATPKQYIKDKRIEGKFILEDLFPNLQKVSEFGSMLTESFSASNAKEIKSKVNSTLIFWGVLISIGFLFLNFVFSIITGIITLLIYFVQVNSRANKIAKKRREKAIQLKVLTVDSHFYNFTVPLLNILNEEVKEGTIVNLKFEIGQKEVLQASPSNYTTPTGYKLAKEYHHKRQPLFLQIRLRGGGMLVIQVNEFDFEKKFERYSRKFKTKTKIKSSTTYMVKLVLPVQDYRINPNNTSLGRQTRITSDEKKHTIRSKVKVRGTSLSGNPDLTTLLNLLKSTYQKVELIKNPSL